MDPKQAPQAVAQITIQMLSNGQVITQLAGQINRAAVNGMLETAKQDLVEILREKEKQKVVEPPIGLDLGSLR